jgi:hypothetical protein
MTWILICESFIQHYGCIEKGRRGWGSVSRKRRLKPARHSPFEIQQPAGNREWEGFRFGLSRLFTRYTLADRTGHGVSSRHGILRSNHASGKDSPPPEKPRRGGGGICPCQSRCVLDQAACQPPDLAHPISPYTNIPIHATAPSDSGWDRTARNG